MSVGRVRTRDPELAGQLGWLVALRAVAALAVAAYALAGVAASPAGLARPVAIYWCADAITALWAGLFTAKLAMNRVALVGRGIAGLVAALVMLALPHLDRLGQWQPGQLIVAMWTSVSILAVVVLQMALAATVDVMIALEARRLVPGEWSLLVGAAVSVLLGLLAAAGLLGAHIGLGLAIVGIGGGLVLLVGAFRLRSAG